MTPSSLAWICQIRSRKGPACKYPEVDVTRVISSVVTKVCYLSHSIVRTQTTKHMRLPNPTYCLFIQHKVDSEHIRRNRTHIQSSIALLKDI